MRILLALVPVLLVFTACTNHSLDNSWTLREEGIRVEIRGEPYQVSVYDRDGKLVLQSLGAGASNEDKEDGFAPIAWTTGKLNWRPGVLTKGQFEFQAHLDPWRERFFLRDARATGKRLTLTYESGGGEVTVTHELRASTLRVSASITSEKPRAWAFSFAAPGTEGYLGMGERFTRTNFRGLSVYSWAEEGGIGEGEDEAPGPGNPYPNGESMTYFPVPFFLSTHGYGVWLDSTWRNTFDFASVRGDAWRVWDTGPKLAFEVYVPKVSDSRPWPYHIIDLFTETVGRPMLPPDWVLGPRRRVGPNDQALGIREIEAMRNEDLAITAVDDAYHFLPKGSHVGNEDMLAQWTADAHALGYKVLGYYNSLLADVEDSKIRETLEAGMEKGYFLRDADGKLSPVHLISGTLVPVYQVDFTDPDATAWFQGLLDWALDLGYDGWMQDFGEYVQPEMVALNGMTGEELHNLYPVLYDKAVFDHMQASPKKDNWLAFARSGYTGSSAYVPAVWSGDPAASFEDADGLPSMVRAGVNIGIAGAPHWGGDIGGFHCNADGGAAADGELWTRWIQQGALTPIMMDQSACVFATDGVKKASIWTSADAKQAWHTYARLHTRLFPYIYSYSHRAAQTGEPIMRHLFLEHPDQPGLASVDDVYYFGEALLVAPVVKRGGVTKQVTLPPGEFLAWPEAIPFAGSQTVTVDAPLAKLPLFLRDGYLAPMLDAGIDTLAPEHSPAVVGPQDVSDVYDVVGYLADATVASFPLWNGDSFSVQRTGRPDLSAYGPAVSEAALATCPKVCWRLENLDDGVERLRISAADRVTAGGLTLQGVTKRRVRWDLYFK